MSVLFIIYLLFIKLICLFKLRRVQLLVLLYAVLGTCLLSTTGVPI